MISDDFIVYTATSVFILEGCCKMVITNAYAFSKSTDEWVEVFIWPSPSSNTGQDTNCLHRYLRVLFFFQF